MHTADVLHTPVDLTAAWLSAALGAPVRGFTYAPIGTGQISGTYRISLDWDGQAEAVILKLADSNPSVRATGMSMGFYEREVYFYREIAGRLPSEALAKCYAASYEESTGFFTLLMEDIAPARPGDQLAGCTIDEAREIVGELARLQAPLFGDTDLAAAMEKEPPADSMMLEIVLPMYYVRFAGRVSDEHRAVMERFVQCFDSWSADRTELRLLSHVDFRLDNILFGEAGSDRPVTVVDWATIEWGPATKDLAFFIGGSLTIEDRRTHEEELVHLYYDELTAHGVTGYSWDDCWRGYRWNAFAGVLMATGAPMVAAQTERGDDMFMVMLARHCQQVIDLNSMELLEEARAKVIQVDPADESRHEPEADRYWNESWYLDAISADGTLGAYVRIGFVPNLNQTVFTAYVCGEGRPSVGVLDYAAPMPATGMTVTTDAFTSELTVEESLKRVRVTLAGTGESFDDPSAPLRGEHGTPVPVEFDLRWETEGLPYRYQITPRYEMPCHVTGTITVGDEVLTLDGPGQRDHSWGPRDWWAMDWTWMSAHLDDDTRIQGVELRFPGIPVTAVGYEQNGSDLIELKAIDSVYETPASRVPSLTTTTNRPGGTQLEFEPIAYGNLRIEAPDGRVCEFPRAMARIRTPDGRTGLGWLEWGHNVAPVSTPSRTDRALAPVRYAKGVAEKFAMGLVGRVPDTALENLMISRAGRPIVAAIFQVLPGRIDHRAADGIDAIVRFKVRHPASGDVEIQDLVLDAASKPHVERRLPDDAVLPEPRVTFSLSAPDLLALATGRIDPIKAAVTRQILIEGDIAFMPTIAALFAGALSD